jgi:hypothetical protein
LNDKERFCEGRQETLTFLSKVGKLCFSAFHLLALYEKENILWIEFVMSDLICS